MAPPLQIIHYDQLPDEVKQKLSPEMRAAMHAMKNDVQVVAAAVDVNTLRLDRLSDGARRLSQQMDDHLVICNQQKETMAEVLQAVTAIKGTFRVADFLKDAFVWAAGFAMAAHTIYSIFFN